MIVSNYKHYEELPLFLNAKTVAQEKFIQWVELQSGGDAT